MSKRLKSSSAGMKEWLEATRGWTISAYVESNHHVNYPGGAKDDVSRMGRPRPALQQRRSEWPFGENIRDVIRVFRGR